MQKLKEKTGTILGSIKEITHCEKLNTIFTFLIIPFAIFYLEVVLKLTSEIAGFDYHIFGILLNAIGFGFILNCISFIFKNDKVKRWIIGIFLEILSIWFTINYFINESYTTFMNIKDIIMGTGDVVGDFKDTLISLIVNGVGYILLFQIPVILFLIFKKSFSYTLTKKKILVLFIIGILIFVSSIGFQFITSLDREKMLDNYEFDSSIRTFGLLEATRTDLTYLVFGHTTSIVIDEEEIVEPEPVEIVYERNTLKFAFNDLIMQTDNTDLKNLYSYLMTQKGTYQNEYTGLFEGKNLILIAAESFAKELIDPIRTPALYRLSTKGINFTDYYQPAWGGSTSTGEYSILTGMIPTSYVSSIQETIGKNMWTTMGNQLSSIGYYTIGYHNNTYTYYDRHLTHKNLGFSEWIGMGNGMEYGVNWIWPESDLEMVQYTFPQYIDKQPFMVYYMSVSGHPNYTYGGNNMVQKNWDLVSDLNCSDILKGYIACNLELEFALEYLLEQLEVNNMLDDTVICLSADHYPYGLCSDVWESAGTTLYELYGITDSMNKVMRDHNALIIWSGCLEHMDDNNVDDIDTIEENEEENLEELDDETLTDEVKEDSSSLPIVIDDPVYSLDILPTLCNLFGVKYDSRLLVGRDIFSNADPLVIWNDHSFLTRYGYYDAPTGVFTPSDKNIYDGDINSYLEKTKRLVGNKFTLSRAILSTSIYNDLYNARIIEIETIDEVDSSDSTVTNED